MISLLTLSSSSTLANSPSLEAAARRTMGVSSEHRFRKYLGVGMGLRRRDPWDPKAAGNTTKGEHRCCSHAVPGFAWVTLGE